MSWFPNRKLLDRRRSLWQWWVGHQDHQAKQPGKHLKTVKTFHTRFQDHLSSTYLRIIFPHVVPSSPMAGIKGVIAKRHNGATQSGTGFGSGTPQDRKLPENT